MKPKNFKQSLFLNKYLFFQIEAGKILVWDYKKHEQFYLEKEYFLELVAIDQNLSAQNPQICAELLNAGLLLSEKTSQQEWKWDVLSKIFHFGTRDILQSSENISNEDFDKKYLEANSKLNDIPNMFSEKTGEIINLPHPDLSLIQDISLLSVLKNRKTCRAFDSEFISINELSLILFMSFGLFHGNWEEFSDLNLATTAIRKTSPASGGIHAEEIYVIIFRINDLLPGLYHYRTQDHKLTLIKPGNFEAEVVQMNYKQYFSSGLSFGIYLTSRFEKIWWKYHHSRAYKSILLDTGHISQTFLLSATALGMQTWLTAAFEDSKVEKFLEINSDSESVILFVGAGKGSNESIPASMAAYINSKDWND